MSISTLPTNSDTNDAAVIRLQKQLIDIEDNMIVYNGKTPVCEKCGYIPKFNFKSTIDELKKKELDITINIDNNSIGFNQYTYIIKVTNLKKEELNYYLEPCKINLCIKCNHRIRFNTLYNIQNYKSFIPNPEICNNLWSFGTFNIIEGKCHKTPLKRVVNQSPIDSEIKGIFYMSEDIYSSWGCVDNLAEIIIKHFTPKKKNKKCIIS